MRKKMKFKRIKNIQQLKDLAAGENGIDCFVLLNHNCKSSKHIIYEPNDRIFFVINFIDDSEQEIKEDDIFNKEITNIGEAIKKGSLIMEMD